MVYLYTFIGENMGFIDDWKEWGTGKKILSIVVVCCLALIVIGLITGGASPDANTSSSDSSSSGDDVSGVQVKVTYDGQWSGSIMDGEGTSQSFDGTGPETIDVEGDSWSMVSTTFQKRDIGSGKMTVEIIKDGKVAKSGSTSAQYGVVSVAD